MISETPEVRVEADGSITVGEWVSLVMAMVGCVGAWMKVMVSGHAGLGQEELVACRETPERFHSAR